MAETKTLSINGKFLLALKNMKDPVRNAEGYNFTYANLPQITSIIRPSLQEQGLDFSQRSLSIGEGETMTYFLETRIFDDKSEMILDRRPLHFSNDAQKSGSYETYMRRYALLTVFGLAPKDEDDDGFKTTPDSNYQQPKQEKPKPKQSPTAKEETLSTAKSKTKQVLDLGTKQEGLTSYLTCNFPDVAKGKDETDKHYLLNLIKSLDVEGLNKYISHVNQLISDHGDLQRKEN